MRALIVDNDCVAAWSVADKLLEAGFVIVGPARSSGEALLLAGMERPDVAILSVNLESIGAGERLASRLRMRHATHCILTRGAAEQAQATDSGYYDRADHSKIADAAVTHRKRRR
jgi:DNA-binding response OmpR family regulator